MAQTTKLENTDKLLLQRGQTNYSIYASELLGYQLDGVSDELEGFEKKLDQEILDRIQGDDELGASLGSYIDFVREGFDLLFPSYFETRYSYKTFVVEQSLYENSIRSCEGAIDPNDTDEEKEAARAECYKSAVIAVYNSLSAISLNKQFSGLIDGTIHNYKSLHTIYVSGDSADSESPDYDSLAPGDYIKIAKSNSEGKPSLDNYGLYKVVKNLSKDYVDSGELTLINDYRMLQVEYNGGMANLPFVATGTYYIRAMQEFRSELDGSYVSKTGDTVTGDLVFQNSNVQLNGTAKVHSPVGDMTFTTVGGEIKISETGGISGLALADGSDQSAAVSVQYLNLDLSNITSDIDTLRNELHITDERVDAIGKIQVQYNFNSPNLNTETEIDEWDEYIENNMAAGEIRFFDSQLGQTDIGAGANQRIVISKTHADTGIVELDTTVAGDFLEFHAQGDGVLSQDFIYKVLTIDTAIAEYYVVDATIEHKFGEPGVQLGVYKLKFYGAQQGITLDQADDRYLSNTGDIVTGPMEIKPNPTGTGAAFKVTHLNDPQSFTINEDGGVDVNVYDPDKGFSIRWTDTNGLSIFAFNEFGINATYTEAGKGFKIALNGSKDNCQLEIKQNSADWNNLVLQNITTTGAAGEAVSVDYYNDALFGRFVAGSGIALNKGADGKVTVSYDPTHVFSLDVGVRNLRDVEDSQLKNGDTLIFDSESGKFKTTSPFEAITGKRLMATNEDDAEIGGLWSDGNHFYIKYK